MNYVLKLSQTILNFPNCMRNLSDLALKLGIIVALWQIAV